MHYARIATYDLIKGNFSELTALAAEGILPAFSSEPGFVNYGLVDAGHNKVVSISIWERREEAQRASTTASTWIKDSIPDRIRLVTSYVGDVALFRGAPVTA